MKFTKQYKITTTHKTKSGLSIPSGFFVQVGRVSADPLDSVWRIRVEVRFFKSKSKADSGNDINGVDTSFLETTFEKSNAQDAIDLLRGTDNLIKPQLESEFGASNVKPPS